MSNKNFEICPNIEYRGSVRISLIGPDGKVIRTKKHNNGLDPLFRFLAMCLSGRDVHSSYPSKLNIVKHGTNSSILIGGPVSTRDPQYVNEDGWCAILGFTINNSNITNPNSNVDFKLLGRTESGSQEEAFAIVEDISEAVITQLVPGTTLYVEWTLSIKNAK